MPFFEDLGKKISKTSQGAVQKAKDTAEILKLNGMISDEEKRLNTLYAEIGKIYFEIYAQNCEPQFKDIVNQIVESKNKITEYSEQVKKLKGLVSCPKCGAGIQPGSPFCSNCGTRLEVANNPTQTGKVCSNCGSMVTADSLFCTNCGTKIVQTPPPAQKSCPNCGNPVEGTAFCTSCGFKLETAPQPPIQPESVAPVQPEPVAPVQPEPVAPVQPEPVAPVQPEPVVPVQPEPVVPVQPEPVVPVQPEPVVPVQPEPALPFSPEPVPSAQPTQPIASDIKLCHNCGVILENGSIFCTNCGAKVE